MRWRLGLDMGTNSIGWAAFELDQDGPRTLKDAGVRIFSDGRNPKSGEPLNEARRAARGMRRQRDRKIRRKNAMLRYLVAQDYLPKDNAERLRIANELDPYQLRTEALKRDLKRNELARILMQLVTRRGFKSNRKDLQKENSSDQKGMLAGINSLSKELGEKTLGQWLCEIRSEGGSVRFRPVMEKGKNPYPFYPSRDMYEVEFARIRGRQESCNSTLNWDRLHWFIFFQRPLKRPERGQCQFYPEEDRGYKAFASAHRFRILQDVHNLKLIDQTNKYVEIPKELKLKLINVLDHQKTVSFDVIRKKIFGAPYNDGLFNLEDSKRAGLKGNETSTDFRSEDCFGKAWDELSWTEQDRIVETLIIEEEEANVRDFLSQFKLTDIQVSTILGHNFQTGTTMLSSRFMNDCTRVMLDKWLPYHEATKELGSHHSHSEKTVLRRTLPYYGEVLTTAVTGAKGPSTSGTIEEKYGQIANPTVHIALNQLRKLTNALIRRYGRPTEIIMEIGRELKMGQTARSDMMAAQTKNQKENERVKAELMSLGVIHPSGDYIKKYRLWEELSPTGLARRCPYCGKAISATQLIDGDIEIEHILPYSRTLLDSRENLTVAHRACNQFKREKSPFEAFGTSPAGFDWVLIAELSQKLPWRKRNKFAPTAMDAFEKEEGGFLQRQLTDNAYLSKAGKDYLASICDRDSIWVSTGRQTAFLRGEWGLNTILNSGHDTWLKNRSDHRHHALDAIVIGLCDRGLIGMIARDNANRGYHNLAAPECRLSRTNIEKTIANIIVSIKKDHGTGGKLYAETALGKRQFLEKIDPEELDEREIKRVVPLGIRQHIETLTKEKGFKETKAILKKRYAYFRVFRDRWVTRAPLNSLSARDIENICDPLIKKEVLTYLQANNPKGDKKKTIELLTTLSDIRSIKTVRYCPKDQVPHKIDSAPYKAYMPADYFRVDVWEIPEKDGKKRYEGTFIPRNKASRAYTPSTKSSVLKPHPAARFVTSLYKGDCLKLVDAKCDEDVVCIVSSYSTTQNKVDIQPIASASTIQEWKKATNQKLTQPFWPQDCNSQYFKSINVLFSDFKVSLARISVDGRITIRSL